MFLLKSNSINSLCTTIECVFHFSLFGTQNRSLTRVEIAQKRWILYSHTFGIWFEHCVDWLKVLFLLLRVSLIDTETALFQFLHSIELNHLLNYRVYFFFKLFLIREKYYKLLNWISQVLFIIFPSIWYFDTLKGNNHLQIILSKTKAPLLSFTHGSSLICSFTFSRAFDVYKYSQAATRMQTIIYSVCLCACMSKTNV